ncbi:hypothetical protein PVAND_007065 [Polypedilum vanderplanki]|uniref:Uncharacterized protein n=1 Tax=Polypedilum vanderplanki TaxID=319348 RepID=A0A9J6C629_POLVA|nr:hypothetical protein PVAND_007065 [Polypedilum vanderplanki]
MRYLIILILISSACAKQCNDGIVDIHNLITSLYDYTNLMETTIRVQYNQFHTERLNAINSQMSFLKTLQNGFNTETCKYQGVEEGYGIYISSNEYINVVRKNVFYALKSAIDDLRTDNLNLIFSFLNYHNDMVDKIAQQSKNLFSDGKICVINLEIEIKTFFDTTVRKLMEAMRAAANSSPLAAQSIRNAQGTLQNTVRQISYYSRAYFGGTGSGSSKQSNDTVAFNYNTYMKGIFNTIFDVGIGMAQIGLDAVAAIDAHTKTVRANVVAMNSTFLTPKRVELLGKIENVCSGM